MLKNLKLLLSLRALLKSGTLKVGWSVAGLAALQTWLSSQDGIDLLGMLAGLVGLAPSTMVGVVGALTGLIMLVLRAKTEWSLSEKVTGVPEPTPPVVPGS